MLVKSDSSSLDFVINHVLITRIIVKSCQLHFKSDMPSTLLTINSMQNIQSSIRELPSKFSLELP